MKTIDNSFTEKLMAWYNPSHRLMPWKEEKDPYLIWLSEIILQQTRVEQGLAYFLKFKKNYPTVIDLANAPEDEVMKCWEGLGYYSRARNLHFTAKYIAKELNGFFPTRYEDIITLKGVGSYTAAAIASFAYDLPYSVLDGNVYRVLSRHFGLEKPIDDNDSKKYYGDLAQQLLDEKNPARYNQALMDFGATLCTPQNPKCSECPLKESCVALEKNMVSTLPIKQKKMKKRTRYFHYLIINRGEETTIRKRTEKDIWQDLYEFPLIEADQLLDAVSVVEHAGWPFNAGEYRIKNISEPQRQQLTHQLIISTFVEIETDIDVFKNIKNYININKKNVTNFAFPKTIDWYFQNKSLTLSFI